MSNIYDKSRIYARFARRLAEETDNLISHSEAMMWALYNITPPPLIRKQKSETQEQVIAKYIKEELELVYDEDVIISVTKTIIESVKHNFLLYTYNEGLNEWSKPRVRILSRIIWDKIFKERDIERNMATKKSSETVSENIEVKETETKSKAKKSKSTVADDIQAGLQDVIDDNVRTETVSIPDTSKKDELKSSESVYKIDATADKSESKTKVTTAPAIEKYEDKSEAKPKPAPKKSEDKVEVKPVDAKSDEPFKPYKVEFKTPTTVYKTPNGTPIASVSGHITVVGKPINGYKPVVISAKGKGAINGYIK